MTDETIVAIYDSAEPAALVDRAISICRAV
jgi:hypothetical protein